MKPTFNKYHVKFSSVSVEEFRCSKVIYLFFLWNFVVKIIFLRKSQLNLLDVMFYLLHFIYGTQFSLLRSLIFCYHLFIACTNSLLDYSQLCYRGNLLCDDYISVKIYIFHIITQPFISTNKDMYPRLRNH